MADQSISEFPRAVNRGILSETLLNRQNRLRAAQNLPGAAEAERGLWWVVLEFEPGADELSPARAYWCPSEEAADEHLAELTAKGWRGIVAAAPLA